MKYLAQHRAVGFLKPATLRFTPTRVLQPTQLFCVSCCTISRRLEKVGRDIAPGGFCANVGPFCTASHAFFVHNCETQVIRVISARVITEYKTSTSAMPGSLISKEYGKRLLRIRPTITVSVRRRFSAIFVTVVPAHHRN